MSKKSQRRERVTRPLTKRRKRRMTRFGNIKGRILNRNINRPSCIRRILNRNIRFRSSSRGLETSNDSSVLGDVELILDLGNVDAETKWQC